MDKKLEEKLRKLLILSERGIDGEKDNAAVLLERLLKKHGLELSDISDEEISRYWFKYKGAWHERLLTQVILKVAGREVKMWESKMKRSKIGADVTKAQMLEIEMLFDAYKIALDEEMDFTFEAFINKNNLFPQSNKEKLARDCSDEELQRSKLLMNRMLSMNEVKVHKQLSG